MTQPFVFRHFVTFEETNLVGNVYFTHYARWQGHCREHFLAAEAPAVVAALATGELALVTVSCAVDYLAECFAGDVVDVHMRLASHASYRLVMDFTYHRGADVVATGRQQVACMSRNARGVLAPVPLPVDLAAALARYSL